MRNILFAFTFIFNVLTVGAQQIDPIQFEEGTHDFGTVKEEDGPIIHEFKFINNSPDSIKILSVKASCGCTTPGWSKEPVAPGGYGFIKAQYNTRNRPGAFKKSLTVNTSYSGMKQKRLYITGHVVAKVKTIEEELPMLMGGLRVKYNSFNLSKVLTSETPTEQDFEVYNASDSVISFLDKFEGPSYITISFEPQNIAPKQKGKIKVSYKGSERNDFGFVSDNVIVFTDEVGEESRKSFNVYATIQEYFPPMSAEEVAQAPKLAISDVVHDFGSIILGEKVEATFVLKNTGKTPLNIRKTKSTCSCTIAELKKDTIKPGGSAELKVTFNSEGRRGNQQKSITIFSNDPKKPMQRVTLKGVVKLGEQ